MSSWMEFHRTHPIFVPLAGHNQLGLVHRPYFPEHVVTACSDDGLFGVEDNSANRHGVAFLRLSQHSLLVVKGFNRPGRSWFLLREGSELSLLAIDIRLGLNGGKCFFLGGCFSLEFVSFNLDEHLFLHGEVILLSKLIILLLVFPLK